MSEHDPCGAYWSSYGPRGDRWKVMQSPLVSIFCQTCGKGQLNSADGLRPWSLNPFVCPGCGREFLIVVTVKTRRLSVKERKRRAIRA